VVGYCEHDNEVVPQNAGNVFTSGETLASHTGLWPVQLVNSFLILVNSSSNVYLAILLRNFISAVSLCSHFHGSLIFQCCILMVR
jgi:hypothetical protein